MLKSATTTRRSHFETLDGLRGVAASVVLSIDGTILKGTVIRQKLLCGVWQYHDLIEDEWEGFQIRELDKFA
jgi:hypothetical protein